MASDIICYSQTHWHLWRPGLWHWRDTAACFSPSARLENAGKCSQKTWGGKSQKQLMSFQRYVILNNGVKSHSPSPLWGMNLSSLCPESPCFSPEPLLVSECSTTVLVFQSLLWYVMTAPKPKSNGPGNTDCHGEEAIVCFLMWKGEICRLLLRKRKNHIPRLLKITEERILLFIKLWKRREKFTQFCCHLSDCESDGQNTW